jgi:FixJ family two-component response regulator
LPDIKPSFVVVDDDAEMGQAISSLLHASGYRATVFQSAEAMLADEAALAADCFILDVHLPGLSGFELRQRIALQRAGAAVILMTADDSGAVHQRARAEGAVAIFLKPFGGPAFLATIAEVLADQSTP